MQNYLIAVIRTLVPLVVGWVVAHLVRLIPGLPTPTPEQVNDLTLLVASLYYIGVAWLERKFPWFGWLLGVARNPIYSTQAARDLVLADHAVLPAAVKRSNEQAALARTNY